MRSAHPFKRLQQSFRTRVFALLTLLILVITTTFTTFHAINESDSATERLDTEGELLARFLAYNSRLAVFAEHPDMLREAAEGIFQHEHVLSTAIFTVNGKLLAERSREGNEVSGVGREIPPEMLLTVRRLAAGEKKSVHFEEAGRVEFFAPIVSSPGYASPESLFFDDVPAEERRTIGLVRVTLDKTELNASIRKLLLTALAMGAVFLLLGSALVFLVTQGLTRPLSNLMEGVKSLGEGDFAAQIPVETDDELGEVSHAFNTMAQALEKREAENRALEEQLRLAQQMAAKEEWERTFDTVPDLIAILDGDQRIVRVNKSMADRLGVSKDEAIGTRLYEQFHGNETPLPSCRPSALLVIDTAHFQKGELKSFFFVTVSPLLNSDGSMFGSVYVARDVTEKKQAEEENKAIQAKLVQTNKMTSLGLMVSGLAHEVNNPNNNIKLTAHLLAKSWQDILPVLERQSREQGEFTIGGQSFAQAVEVLPQHIAGIRDNARRIEGIIKNLREFARKGVANLNFKAEINTIVSVAASILNTQIRQHTRHFRLRLQEGLPTVRGNPQQLEQVVINLIMNAIQALPDRERQVLVSTSLDRDGGLVVITVADEGEGMPPEVRNRICEPFFSTKLDRGGTGLGLAISNFIVMEHRGTLEFESEPNQGTTALVKLPAEQG
ncbi:MAG: ATP-binding protein [Geobacteraceae bacterium]|nr:ATP-binding protein [Geobacteraceae bacterium]